MLKAGCDIRCIQSLLGHASLSTTQLQTRVDISDLARAHARFHPRSFPEASRRLRPTATPAAARHGPHELASVDTALAEASSIAV